MTLAGAAALALAGCSGGSNLFDSSSGNSSTLFSKPLDNIFSKPDWGHAGAQSGGLSPTGSVGPEEFVNPDGSCAPSATEAAQVAAAPAQAEPVPDRLQSEGGGIAPASPTVLGGVALGMTECQVVRRAGAPTNVAISADEKNERKVVVTYTSGGWPGIYTFMSGRLKVVDMLPEQQKPKPPARKPVPKRAKTS